MMKRFLSALAALLLCASCAAGEETGKYDTLPEIFAITVEEAERKIDDGSAYVYKEYVTTVNPEVNAALRALVDGYDEAISPTLEMDPRKKGKRGSALNIDTVYYRTGTQYLSTLTIARASFREEQRSTDFTTRTWDLESGQRLLLTDLFAPDSDAWEILSQGVREHLSSIFPGRSGTPKPLSACAPGKAWNRRISPLAVWSLRCTTRPAPFFPGR